MPVRRGTRRRARTGRARPSCHVTYGDWRTSRHTSQLNGSASPLFVSRNADEQRIMEGVK